MSTLQLSKMEIGDAEDLHFRGNLSLDLNCLSKAFYFILYIIVLIKLEGRDTNCLCLIQQVCSKTYSVCPDRLGQSIGEFEIANLVTLFVQIIADGPSVVKLMLKRRHLSAGKSHQIKCEAIGAKPQATISWWVGGKEVRNILETLYRVSQQVWNRLRNVWFFWDFFQGIFPRDFLS